MAIDTSLRVDAEFTEVRETKNNNKNLPATLDTVCLHRHTLMEGKVTEAAAKAAEELAIDKELGLLNQAKATANHALQKDIDELTTSNNYFEVTKETIEKLFGLTSLKFQCSIHAFKSYWSAMFNGWVRNGGALYGIIALVASSIGLSIALNISWKEPIPLNFLSVVLFVLSLAFLIGSIAQLANVSSSYSTIDVDLSIKPIHDISTPIPYGAKLKVLEAKKSGIFEDFVMAEINFETNRRNITPPRMNIDPAILGVTKDNRMFMIVYWDVKHDIEKTKMHIKRLNKFKLPKV